MTMQVRRTPLGAPANNSLADGQLCVEMGYAGAPRLWVGVGALDVTGRRLVADSSAYLLLAGTYAMTGPLTLSGPPTAPLHAVSMAYVDAAAPHGQLWVTTAGAHTVPAGTRWVFVNVAGGGATVILPVGGPVTVMDRGPHAAASPIVLRPPGAQTINGGPEWVIATNWGVANIIFDGANYGVG